MYAACVTFASHASVDLTARAEPVQPGIWRLQVPLHARAEPVNVWLLRDPADGSIVVFDTGIAPHAPARWRAVLDQLRATPADVRSIVVSHQHPDHVGGTGSLHQLTGAPVLASASAIEQVLDVWGDNGRLEAYMGEVRDHLRRNGLPAAIAERLRDDHVHARAAIELAPDAAWQPLADGAQLDAGGRTWRVVFTPGHSDGQFVLHDEDGGLLLSADHLLERISPAVGKFPRHEPDPLRRYLESLERVAALTPVELVLPGHGAPFRGAADRARVLIDHHAQRIDACVAAVRAAAAPVTAYDVASVVFAKVFATPEPDAPSIRFATTESLAHLEFARLDGRIAFARDDEELATYT